MSSLQKVTIVDVRQGWLMMKGKGVADTIEKFPDPRVDIHPTYWLDMGKTPGQDDSRGLLFVGDMQQNYSMMVFVHTIELGVFYTGMIPDFINRPRECHSAYDDNSADKLFASCLAFASFALQLLSCPNVGTCDLPQSEINRSTSKRARQNFGIKDYRIQTIEITFPGKERVSHDSRGGAFSGDLPLHMIRGHFKDYRENGLFGQESLKHIYWWPSMVRGSEDQGEVGHEYRLVIDPQSIEPEPCE